MDSVYYLHLLRHWELAYFSVEKYCWRLFNLASLNVSEKVKFAKFAKYKGTLNIRDLQYHQDCFEHMWLSRLDNRKGGRDVKKQGRK